MKTQVPNFQGLNFQVLNIIETRSGRNAEPHLISGWSSPESTHTWTDGTKATLRVDAPATPHGMFLEIAWDPFVRPLNIPAQVITVSVNGTKLRSLALSRGRVHAFYCGPEHARGGELLFNFEIPEAASPSEIGSGDDRRRLGIAVKRVRILGLAEPWRMTADDEPVRADVTAEEIPALITQAERHSGVPLKQMLNEFEALAGNCDMGLALRSLGFESLSFLRFGGATPQAAQEGIETDFENAGRELEPFTANNEWMVNDRFGLLFHTHQASDSVSEADMLKRFRTHFGFLRQKFLETLEEADKIYVCADHREFNHVRTIEEILPLFFSLKRRGVSRLLWVCPAPNVNLAGSVRFIAPGLGLGYLDPTQPPMSAAGGVTIAGWLRLLCSAYLKFQAAEPTGRS